MNWSDNICELYGFFFRYFTELQNMNFSKKKNIETYGKYDLFRRFSLDIFAALYLIFEKENKGSNQSIKKAYHDVRKYINEQELEDRIKEVRN
jgi:hypothetical protein